MRAKRKDEAKLIFQQFHPFVNASSRIEVLTDNYWSWNRHQTAGLAAQMFRL